MHEDLGIVLCGFCKSTVVPFLGFLVDYDTYNGQPFFVNFEEDGG